jgi:transcriptional regulator with XRE-family HTH domain
VIRGGQSVTAERGANLHIGRLIAGLRSARNLNQSQLARKSGVKCSLISQYEAGAITPTASTLLRLLEALDFRWSAIDLTRWYLDRLFSECVLSDGERLRIGDTTLLPTVVAEVEELAAHANRLLRVLEGHAAVASPTPARPKREAAAGEPCEEDRIVARELWQAIKPLPPQETAKKIRCAPAPLAWALCELVCKESRWLSRENAQRAVSLMRRCLGAADQVPGAPAWQEKVKGFMWAHLAHALFAQGEIRDAGRAFATATRHWEAGAAAHPGLLSEGMFHLIGGNMRREQHRFDEAEEFLARAEDLADTPTLAARVWISRAKLYEARGDLEEALTCLDAVEPAVPQEERRLHFVIQHNRTFVLGTLERFDEAKLLLPAVRELAKGVAGEMDRIRMRWSEGRIAAGLGRTEEGAEALSRVRGEFATRNMHYDLALVSLELAALHAKQGRHDAVKALARHMAPIFQARNVHREALAALTLFRQAAEKEAVTAALARDVLAYLWKARCRPELVFRGRQPA